MRGGRPDRPRRPRHGPSVGRLGIFRDGQRDFSTLYFNAGLRGKDWRFVVFVKNATNDTTPSNGLRYFDAATFRRTAVDFLPRRRQTGVTLSYDF
jgi:hypothetical protein